MANKLGLGRRLRKFRNGKRRMMRQIGTISLKWFRSSFTQQGFKNVAVRRWKARKKPKSKPILTDTGRLKASGRVQGATAASVKMAFTAPYAGFQNVGTSRIPERKFIGDSAGLDRANLRFILATVDRIMRF